MGTDGSIVIVKPIGASQIQIVQALHEYIAKNGGEVSFKTVNSKMQDLYYRKQRKCRQY